MTIRNEYYEITVTGKGDFPFDMLRYSRAFPIDAESAEAMTFDTESRIARREKRTVILGLHAGNYLTADNCVRRFESFGWKAEITREEIEQRPRPVRNAAGNLLL